MPDLAKLHCMEQEERHALHTGYPPDRLGWSQSALRAANRDLPHLRIYAQAHVGPPNRIAFVVVHGVGEDRDRRRRVRAEARLRQSAGASIRRDFCVTMAWVGGGAVCSDTAGSMRAAVSGRSGNVAQSARTSGTVAAIRNIMECFLG